MGLDTTYYRGLTRIEGTQNESGDLIGTDGHVYEEGNFYEMRRDPWPERCEDFKDGYYSFKERDHAFSSAYSSYNTWREGLAELAGYEAKLDADAVGLGRAGRLSHSVGAWDATEGPFWELINFSDCEGVIGADVSAKLHADFVAYRGRASAFAKGDQQWFVRYCAWEEAFRHASDGGCVDFH